MLTGPRPYTASTPNGPAAPVPNDGHPGRPAGAPEAASYASTG